MVIFGRTSALLAATEVPSYRVIHLGDLCCRAVVVELGLACRAAWTVEMRWSGSLVVLLVAVAGIEPATQRL